MNFNHQQDDTGGLLALLLSLIFFIIFISFCIWLGKHP